MTEEQTPIAPATTADPYPWIKKSEPNAEPLLPSETVNPIGHVIYHATNVEIKGQPNVK